MRRINQTADQRARKEAVIAARENALDGLCEAIGLAMDRDYPAAIASARAALEALEAIQAAVDRDVAAGLLRDIAPVVTGTMPCGYHEHIGVPSDPMRDEIRYEMPIPPVIFGQGDYRREWPGKGGGK